MSQNKPSAAEIRETIARLRKTAEKLLAEGKPEKASELIEEAAKLEDMSSRDTT